MNDLFCFKYSSVNFFTLNGKNKIKDLHGGRGSTSIINFYCPCKLPINAHVSFQLTPMQHVS